MTYYKMYILHNYYAQFLKYLIFEEQLLSHGCSTETSATASKIISKIYWCLSIMPVSFPHLKWKRATVSLVASPNKTWQLAIGICSKVKCNLLPNMKVLGILVLWHSYSWCWLFVSYVQQQKGEITCQWLAISGVLLLLEVYLIIQGLITWQEVTVRKLQHKSLPYRSYLAIQ